MFILQYWNLCIAGITHDSVLMQTVLRSVNISVFTPQTLTNTKFPPYRSRSISALYNEEQGRLENVEISLFPV